MNVPFENLYNFQWLRLGVSSDVMPCSLIEAYQVFKRLLPLLWLPDHKTSNSRRH